MRSVFGHLRKVDAVLSTWRADSDLLRLQHAEVAPGSEDVHDWIAEVTSLCLQAEERTDGLFAAWRVLDSGRIAFDPHRGGQGVGGRLGLGLSRRGAGHRLVDRGRG